MSTCGAGWINAAYIEGNGGGRAGGGAEPRLTRAPLGESRATHLDTVRAEESEIHRARRELVANGDGHASARPPGQGAAHAAALEGGERRQHRHHHGGCNFKARTREKQRRCSKQASRHSMIDLRSAISGCQGGWVDRSGASAGSPEHLGPRWSECEAGRRTVRGRSASCWNRELGDSFSESNNGCQRGTWEHLCTSPGAGSLCVWVLWEVVGIFPIRDI